MIEVRVGDNDGANAKLFFMTQADRDRARVNRERVVDQIGGQ
jgi:hypothetical protein